MTKNLLSLYITIKKSFKQSGVIFAPRDIGMWRRSDGSVIDLQRFKSIEEFMEWLDTDTAVNLNDEQHPFQLSYDSSRDRFAVIQWSVIGWLHVK